MPTGAEAGETPAVPARETPAPAVSMPTMEVAVMPSTEAGVMPADRCSRPADRALCMQVSTGIPATVRTIETMGDRARALDADIREVVADDTHVAHARGDHRRHGGGGIRCGHGVVGYLSSVDVTGPGRALADRAGQLETAGGRRGVHDRVRGARNMAHRYAVRH